MNYRKNLKKRVEKYNKPSGDFGELTLFTTIIKTPNERIYFGRMLLICPAELYNKYQCELKLFWTALILVLGFPFNLSPTCMSMMFLDYSLEFTGAMKLDWRKGEFFGDVCVLDPQSFINLQSESRVINKHNNTATYYTAVSFLDCFIPTHRLPLHPLSC